MPNEPTTSLLHYNDCAADSGEPCTCEPPLTTVEEVAGLLFACHETEYIDAETGWACGCDEDGLLELLTLEDVRKHQAADMVAVLTPLLTAELRARVGVLEGQLATAEDRVLIEQGEVIKRDKAVKSLERALDEQRWYGEQLQSSIDGCSGNHLPIDEYDGGDDRG